jgi:uncharacterized protein
MSKPVLHSIHVHPLKAAAGYDPHEVVAEPWGPAGDRRGVLTDGKDRIITQRAHPRMALVRAGSLDGGAILVSAPGREPLPVPVPGPAGTTTVEIWNDRVEGVLAGVTADAWFSDFPGLPVRLAHLDAPATRRPVDPRFARPGGTVGFADGYPLSSPPSPRSTP